MGTVIQDIVDVAITRATARVSRTGFGVPLIIGSSNRFSELYRTYTSISGVAEDFQLSDEEYIAANTLFSQTQHPKKVVIARREGNVSMIYDCSVDVALNNTMYTTTINGNPIQFMSSSSATPASIAAGLVAAILISGEPVTPTDNFDGTYSVSATLPGQTFSLTTDANQSSVQSNAGYSIANQLSLLQASYDDWYAIIVCKVGTPSEVNLDILHAAEWAESRLKMFGTSTGDSDVPLAGGGDIASQLQSRNYNKTWIIYSTDYAQYPEAAWFGLQLPKDPGSTTWKFKTVSGIVADTLTSTQITNLENKNCNYFEADVGGLDIFSSDAVVASGEYIDVIRGIDWLQTRMAERIYSKLVNTEKIPYTDAGIALIEAEIAAQLLEGVRKGLLEEGSWTVTVPEADDVSTADKAARELNDVEFSADLAGAIHLVSIDGTVSL